MFYIDQLRNPSFPIGLVRPQIIKSLVIVHFYIIILVHDVVINNYQLFYSHENVVQKHQKNENSMFFSWFLDKVWEMWAIFLFQNIFNVAALLLIRFWRWAHWTITKLSINHSLKTKSGFIVRSIETSLGRWPLLVAVISVDAYPFWLYQTWPATLRI